MDELTKVIESAARQITAPPLAQAAKGRPQWGTPEDKIRDRDIVDTARKLKTAGAIIWAINRERLRAWWNRPEFPVKKKEITWTNDKGKRRARLYPADTLAEIITWYECKQTGATFKSRLEEVKRAIETLDK